LSNQDHRSQTNRPRHCQIRQSSLLPVARKSLRKDPSDLHNPGLRSLFDRCGHYLPRRRKLLPAIQVRTFLRYKLDCLDRVFRDCNRLHTFRPLLRQERNKLFQVGSGRRMYTLAGTYLLLHHKTPGVGSQNHFYTLARR
jgi:hypothetical protein